MGAWFWGFSTLMFDVGIFWNRRCLQFPLISFGVEKLAVGVVLEVSCNSVLMDNVQKQRNHIKLCPTFPQFVFVYISHFLYPSVGMWSSQNGVIAPSAGYSLCLCCVQNQCCDAWLVTVILSDQSRVFILISRPHVLFLPNLTLNVCYVLVWRGLSKLLAYKEVHINPPCLNFWNKMIQPGIDYYTRGATFKAVCPKKHTCDLLGQFWIG